MKTQTTEKKITEYFDHCEKCQKLILARTPDHVNYLMELHMVKHKRKNPKENEE